MPRSGATQPRSRHRRTYAVNMKYADSIVDLVGDTPLVKLQHVTEGVACTVLVKLEYLNPGGSAKDRICLLYTSPSPRDATLYRMPSSA